MLAKRDPPAPPVPSPQLADLLAANDYTLKRRADVVVKIARAQLPAAWKRSLYGKWLALLGIPITGRILDDVIGRRERFDRAETSRKTGRAPGAARRG